MTISFEALISHFHFHFHLRWAQEPGTRSATLGLSPVSLPPVTITWWEKNIQHFDEILLRQIIQLPDHLVRNKIFKILIRYCRDKILLILEPLPLPQVTIPWSEVKCSKLTTTMTIMTMTWPHSPQDDCQSSWSARRRWCHSHPPPTRLLTPCLRNSSFCSALTCCAFVRCKLSEFTVVIVSTMNSEATYPSNSYIPHTLMRTKPKIIILPKSQLEGFFFSMYLS